MSQRLGVLLLLVLLRSPAYADDKAVRFVAPENLSMPLAGFENGQLTRGIIKDLGEAIAERMGRRAVFAAIPSKRAQQFLAAGEADGLCYISKLWATGTFNWTAAMIPDATVLAARPDAPVVKDFKELADQPVAITMGYRYAPVEQALGPHLLRDEAPSVDLDLEKLGKGRVRYALVNKLSYDYETRIHPEWKLREDMVFEPFEASCAFSVKSPLRFEEVEAAVEALIANGQVAAILKKYR
jgi:ABC-type amino acid transport substrate-binding protein